MGRRRIIKYAKELEVEKREFFVSTKLGRKLSEIKTFFSNLPVGIRWFLTLLVSGVISSFVAIMVTVYFRIGFSTIEEINNFLRVQIIVNVVFALMIIVFIVLVIREART